MKKFWRFGFPLLAVLLVLLPTPARADVQDFRIDKFQADYYLTRDQDNVSQMLVKEHIVPTFPDFDQNHGILRAIPKSYDGHSVELTINKVTDVAGKDWRYTTYTENDNLVLKIGDPDAYVHGQQVYNIEYTMRGVTKNEAGKDILFWDINGDQWYQHMQHVEGRVHMAEDLYTLMHQDGRKCFVGPTGSTQECTVRFGDADGQRFVGFAVGDTRGVPAGHTATLQIAFPQGTFAQYKPSTGQLLAWAALAAALVLPPIIALWFMVRQWRRYGRDPKGRGTIVPQYIPPKDISVMMSGIVHKERLDQAAITATFLDLAVRHYLKIYEVAEKKLLGTKKTYEIEVVKDTAALRPEEQAPLSWLFGHAPAVGERVKLKTLSSTLAAQTSAYNQTLDEAATKAGYFKTAPSKAKTPYIIVGVVLAVASFFWLPHLLGLLGAGVIFLVGSVTMPARTQKGVELRDYLLGLAMYMKLAEADRLRMLQSPTGELTQKINIDDKTQVVKLYERLLPYAMLLGIEKQWLKQFAHLYTAQPDWYVGSSAFNNAAFISSINSFNSASAAAFAPATSSGGSGGAGGGGGGGGGGGW